MTQTPPPADDAHQEEDLAVEETTVTTSSASSGAQDVLSQVHSRSRQSFVLAMATMVGAAMIATTATLNVLALTPVAEKLPAPLVTAHPSSLVLGCMDATIDPFNPLGSDTGDEKAPSAATTLWASTNAASTEFLLGGKPVSEPPTALNGKSWGLRADIPAPTQAHSSAADRGASDSAASAADSAAVTASELPHVAALVGQKGGELRGLSILPCTPPTLEHWFAVGATSTGEDAVIRVVNTGSQPSVVTMTAWGASGPLKQLSQDLVVAAGETLSVQPGRYFLNEERLVLRLNADGPGVSAWLHSSAMAGEVPQGSAWIASTVPSSRQVIPGLRAEADHSLRIAVPSISRADGADGAQSEAGQPGAGQPGAGQPSRVSDIHQLEDLQSDNGQSDSAQSDSAQSDNAQSGTPESTDATPNRPQSAGASDNVEVTLRLLDANGTRDVPGGTLSLAENSVLDVSLPEVAENSTLIIDASSPVVAQVLTHHPGTPWPSANGNATLTPANNGQQHWKGRSALTASSSIGRIHLPSASELDTAVTTAFDARIIRPTSVTTPAEGAPAGHELYLINPTDQDLTARYGGEEKTLPAGTSLTLPLSDTAAVLEADEGVYAAIIVRADLPTGPIDAVWPLGNLSLSGLTRAIDLR